MNQTTDALALAKKKLTEAEQELAIARDEVERLEKEKSKLTFKMTKKHIAEYLGCGRTTVWRRLESGKLKSCKAIDVIEYKNNKG